MKLLIAVDMEGISGVINWDQVKPGTSEWQRSRRIMTEDVNAAIAGALEAGVDQVIVSDGHWNADNIMIELLDARATLNSGTPSNFSAVQGIDQAVDAVFFIGFHARAGTQTALLDHTWSNQVVGNVWLNEIQVGETGLNAALCGHFDVPVLLLSGDQAVCQEAQELIPGIETVAVKQSTGRYTANCLHPKEAQKRIKEGASRAIKAFQNGQGPAVFHVNQPVRIEIELKSTEMADYVQIIPGITRLSGKLISFQADDMPAAFALFKTLVRVAGK